MQRYQTSHPPALTKVAVHNSIRRGKATDRVKSTLREESTHGPEPTKQKETTAREDSKKHRYSTRRRDSTKHGESTRRGNTTARDESTRRGETARNAESTRYDDTTRHSKTSRRGDSIQYPDSRVNETAITRKSTARGYTGQTYREDTRQSLAPGMAGRLEVARQELLTRNPGRELALPTRTGSVIQRSGSQTMQQPYYGPPAQYGPPPNGPPYYGPDPYGGDTIAGACEAIGMATLGVGKALQDGVAAYHQGGLPAAGAVAAKTIVQTKQNLEARFPNGLR